MTRKGIYLIRLAGISLQTLFAFYKLLSNLKLAQMFVLLLHIYVYIIYVFYLVRLFVLVGVLDFFARLINLPAA